MGMLEKQGPVIAASLDCSSTGLVKTNEEERRRGEEEWGELEQTEKHKAGLGNRTQTCREAKKPC